MAVEHLYKQEKYVLYASKMQATISSKIQVFWNMTLHRLVNIYKRFEKSQTFFFLFVVTIMQPKNNLQNMGSYLLSRGCNIPEVLSSQVKLDIDRFERTIHNSEEEHQERNCLSKLPAFMHVAPWLAKI